MSGDPVYAIINQKTKNKDKAQSSESKSVADEATYSNIHISAPGRSNQEGGDNGSHCVIYSKVSLPYQDDVQPASPSDPGDPTPRAAATKRGQCRVSLRPTGLLLLLCTLLLVVIVTLCALSISSESSTAEKLSALERNNTEAWRQSKNLREELSESNNTVVQLQSALRNQTEENALLRHQLNKTEMNLTQLLSNYNTLLRKQEDIQTKLDIFKAEVHTKPKDRWEYFRGKWYYFSYAWKTWDESRRACQTKGGDLVIIETKEEQEYISTHKNNYWIGLRYLQGNWRWVDNRELTSPSYVQHQTLWSCCQKTYRYNTNSLNNWDCKKNCWESSQSICQSVAAA